MFHARISTGSVVDIMWMIAKVPYILERVVAACRDINEVLNQLSRELKALFVEGGIYTEEVAKLQPLFVQAFSIHAVSRAPSPGTCFEHEISVFSITRRTLHPTVAFSTFPKLISYYQTLAHNSARRFPEPLRLNTLPHRFLKES